MAPKRKRTLTRSLWSELPVDIVDNIFRRLDLPVDVISFSAVCKPWRSVALGTLMNNLLYCKLPLHLFVPKRRPLPMLLHPGCRGPNQHRLYSLNQRRRYVLHSQELSNKWIVGSGAGWLVTVGTTDQEVGLLNPLTQNKNKIPLPHLSTVPPAFDATAYHEEITSYWHIRKVIVGYYRGSILIVALVSHASTIRFCRMGDVKWTKVEKSPINVDDIIINNSKLYACNNLGTLFEIDIAAAGSTKVTIIAVLSSPPVIATCYLVGLCGELVMVTRMLWASAKNRLASMTSEFGVFKLAEDDDQSGYFRTYKSEAGRGYAEKSGHSWVPLENLNNHVVFIGYNHSISLDSRVYPRCKGNRIYFADHRVCDDLGRGTGLQKRIYHDAGVWRMKDGAVRGFEYLSNASSRLNMVWLSPSFSNEIEVEMIPQ